jgi:hypothetical protein
VTLVALSLLTLAGCGLVYTVEPVGTVPVALDPLEWNGYWTGPGNEDACGRASEVGETECLIVTVIDPAQGLLSVAGEGDAAEPARAYVRLADKPGAMFITLEDDSPNPVRPFYFVRALRRPGSNSLFVWMPLKDQVARLVASGVLPSGGPLLGAPDASTIGPLDAAQFELLNRTMKWELFDWEDPDILVRVPPPDQSGASSR